MTDISSRSTPINDLYPTCEHTEASLALYHVDPEFVTARLGLTPTRTQKEGVPRTMKSGREVIGRMNSWVLSSEDDVSSKDLRRHLDWLLDRIEPVAAILRELQQLPSIKMTVSCVWWSARGQGGPTLWPEQMARMAKMNLECGFSFAWYGDYDRLITPDQLLVHPDESVGDERKMM